MINAIKLGSFVAAPDSDPYLADCVDTANDLIKAYTGAVTIPESVLDRATLEVAADLYHRRSARNGVAGFDDNDINPVPVRINRDPLVPARPILAPYMGVPIA